MIPKVATRSRIVHLTTVHAWNDIRIFQKEARTLANAGYDVVLVATRHESGIVDGVEVSAIPAPGSRLKRATVSQWQSLRQALRANGCVYHIHDPELFPAALCLRAAGMNVVFDVHEDLPGQIAHKSYIPAPLRGLASRMAAMEMWLAGRLLTAIVAATPAIARRFPASKTVVVQNFPMAGEFLTANPPCQTERPARVAYVGGLTPERGGIEMAQAIALVAADAGVELCVAGRCSQELKNQMTAAAGGRVRFVGSLDRPEVARLLSTSRAGLVLFHPSSNHVESQPNKLFEYMSAGLPVIASDFPLWREIIGRKGCGLLVDPHDPQAIAHAIEWIMNHPEEADAMGERGRAAIGHELNWGREAEKLLEFYARLTS